MSKLLDISALGGFILFACSGWATISLILLFVGYSFFHQWIQGSQCQAKERLDGKTAIITGGTAGIGKEVARILSSRGARVVIGCRDLVKGRKVVDGIKAITHGQIVLLPLDLSSLQSVKKFAEKILETEKHGAHILINNAGFYSPSFKNTVDGHEMVFQVNYLGHFLLVNLLLPLLRVSAPARIINMTSKLNSKNSTDFDDVNSEKDFQPKGSYEKSKVANALFTKELAKRLEGSGVSVYGVNPGSTNTALMKSLMPSLPGHAQTIAEILYGLSTKTPESGAQTTVNCALNHDLSNESGNMYSECMIDHKGFEEDEEVQKKLWALSEKLLNLDFTKQFASSSSVKILDINDTPLPPLPLDATPDTEESPSFSPQEEKFVEMIPQNKNASQKVISSPAFDDAPSAPSRENINAILDNYDNINEKMDSFAEESYNSNQIKEENITLVSSPQSFAIEEEVNEVVNSPSQLMSGIIPNKIEEIGVLNDENTFDLLDNIKNFDKNSLSHPGNFKDDSLLPSQETIEDEKLMMTEEINKNKGMFSDVKDQLLGASHDNLKNVDTVVKENLPDKYDILSEKGHQEVLKELNDFDSHDLQKVNSPGTVDPQEFLRREVVMKEIEGFSSEKLLKTDTITEAYLPTNEDIKHEMSEIESDIKESKKIYSDVMSEVNYFESSNLKSVDTEESVYLPDKIDLSVERALQGVMEEVKDQSKHLSHIEHIKEPVGPDVLMKEEMNRNDTLDSVVHFDKSNLKHSEVDEKSVLPSVEDIQSERLRNNFTHDVESFEKSSLKSTPVNEKNLLPDSNDIQSEKHHYELLAGIESFPHDELKNSEMKEPISPAKLAKQELVRDSVLQDVETYDKSKLTHSFMEEKGILPSSSDIVEERQHLELLTGIESFDSHHLKASSMREPISPMDLAKHEFAHNAMLAGVESYDKLNLTHSETQEKNILPSSSDILHERERVVLEEGSSKFKPLNPREISEPDHQVFEAKEGFMDPKEMMGDVQMFHSKSRNMSGSSSGSLESSNVKSINSTNPLSAPLTTPLTIDEQQRNSSSDEWVKLDKQSGGDLLG